MTEIIGGLLMMSGGGMLLMSSVPLARAHGGRAAETVAALPFTPVPPPDAGLDALLAQLD